MKRLLIGLVLMGFAAATAQAQAPAAPAAEKAPAPALEKVVADKVVEAAVPAGEIILTGKLSKKEDVTVEAAMEVKKEGATEVIKEAEKDTITSKFILTTADGDVYLPEPKAKAGEPTIVLDKFVGKDVKVVAKGKEKMKDGKKVITVHKIISIDIEEAAAVTK